MWNVRPREAPSDQTHLSIALPYGHTLLSGPAISRDGQRVAFTSSNGIEQPQLYVRRLDEAEPRLIPGTEEAVRPFFSPNGQSVAFYARGWLFKVSLTGGAPVRLANSNSQNGGTWMDDGQIVFQRAWNGGFFTVPENGGEAHLLVEPNRPSEYAYTWPHALPGARELVFSRWGDDFSIMSLDLQTMIQKRLVEGWRRSIYLPTGHLLYGSGPGGELWALPYDDTARENAGPVTVVERVDTGSDAGDARFDVSDTGTLAYVSADRRRRSLALVDARGRVTRVLAGEGRFDGLALSPDGRRVAVGGDGLMILDLDRGGATLLAPELEDGGNPSGPVWSQDGMRVTFQSNYEGNSEIYSKVATGIGDFEPVLRKPLDQLSLSYGPQGTLLFLEEHPVTGGDLWLLSPGGTAEPWLVTDAQERDARFSPDGSVVAYMSNASGRREVYVQSRGRDGDGVQVSLAGGRRPRWSPDGSRIYFRQGNAMIEATIDGSDGLSAGIPRDAF